MIERKFVSERMNEFLMGEAMQERLKGVGLSSIKLQKTPLGEKIIVTAARPGLVVGKKGENIKNLTKILKKKFNLENPQIEISEVQNFNLDPSIVAEKIAEALEKFGIMRFKGIAHKAMTDVMNSGARGVEIVLSGKIPSQRAKAWRFYSGYLKKCGDAAMTIVLKKISFAKLKAGVVGIQVSIMPPDVRLPDSIIPKTEKQQQEDKAEAVKAEEKAAEKEDKKPKRKPRKKKEAKAPKEEKVVEEKKDGAEE